MASGPDLFVVCKKCGSEVSPYITECPYCGTRLRKRAPKLERGGVPKEPKAAAPPPDARPAASRARSPASAATAGRTRRSRWSWPRSSSRWRIRIKPAWTLDLVLVSDVTDEYYRAVTTLFVYSATGYEVVALGAIFLFGWLLERRHGAWATLLVFFAGGVGGHVPGHRRRRRRRRRGRQRRRARRCWRRGRCATCSAAGAATRTTRTCSACWRSPPCSSCCRSPPRRPARSPAWAAALIGVILGALLARLPER